MGNFHKRLAFGSSSTWAPVIALLGRPPRNAPGRRSMRPRRTLQKSVWPPRSRPTDGRATRSRSGSLQRQHHSGSSIETLAVGLNHAAAVLDEKQEKFTVRVKAILFHIRGRQLASHDEPGPRKMM